MNRIAQFFRDYSFAGFFLPLGLILIVVGGFMLHVANTRQSYPQAVAVVSRTELDEEAHYEGNEWKNATYRIFVKYSVDGTEYEEELGVFPEMNIGATMRIDYNPSDPTDISQPVAPWMPIAFFGGGAAALVAAGVSIVRTRKKNQRLKAQEEEWAHGN